MYLGPWRTQEIDRIPTSTTLIYFALPTETRPNAGYIQPDMEFIFETTRGCAFPKPVTQKPGMLGFVLSPVAQQYSMKLTSFTHLARDEQHITDTHYPCRMIPQLSNRYREAPTVRIHSVNVNFSIYSSELSFCCVGSQYSTAVI